MKPTTGGQSTAQRQREAAMELARKKVLAAYSSDGKVSNASSMKRVIPSISEKAAISARAKVLRDFGHLASDMSDNIPSSYKQTPIPTNVTTQKNVSAADKIAWQKYHSAWQYYYQKYYSEYYAKAANQYIEGERLKDARKKSDAIISDQPVDPTDEEEKSIISSLRERVQKRASKEATKVHRHKKFIPIIAGATAVLLILFLQYNRMIFAPIMAYISPGNTSDTGITEIDPTITKAVGPDNRLMIPKLNVDVPVHFGISNDTNTVNAAMENGVAQFAIPGASALPGQIGNLVITGHSAGDIYSNNQYKFIFSGLERLGNGDLIYIDYAGVRYTYSVVKMETVEPDNVSALVYETTKPMLTLITCTPLGTSRYRLLVTAEQINPVPSGAVQTDEIVDDNTENQDSEMMPQNEPTFFERIWNWLTGNG